MLLTWFRKISLIPFSVLCLKSKKRLLSCNYNLLSIAIGEAKAANPKLNIAQLF